MLKQNGAVSASKSVSQVSQSVRQSVSQSVKAVTSRKGYGVVWCGMGLAQPGLGCGEW